jgi:type IV pilus assembly protein PilN
MPRINLLPWRDQQRKERKLAFFVALGAATGAAALATFAAYLLFGSMIDAQEQRNARLRTEIKVLDKQIEEINDLEQQKQRFISRMQVIDKLQRSRPEVVHVLDELVKAMPDGTYLTAVTQTDRRLKLEGVAQSSTRVSTLMRNIAASQWLRDPELEIVETQKDNGLGSSFVLYANQITATGDDDGGGAKGGGKAGAGRRTASAGAAGSAQ